MRANELMVNDWVGAGYVSRVTGIDLKTDAIRIGGNIGYFKANEHEPIPITPEILKANGFFPKNKFKSIWRKILDDVDYRIEIHFQDNGEIEVKVAENQTNYNYIVYHGNYIHSLQHALRLAGLDKIADNFIIEKGGEE